MMSGDFIQMTTISIAGTSGNGAVSLIASGNLPTITNRFGSGKVNFEYTMRQASTGKIEVGLCYVASGVMTREFPQKTFDGVSSYLAGAPATPIQFGSSPTSGDILIQLANTADTSLRAMMGRNVTVPGDTTWYDYPISSHMPWSNSGAGSILTADREYYTDYCLQSGGLLSGVQIDVTNAVASSNIKFALYASRKGLAGAKIVDFTGFSSASTGVKTDTATGSWSSGAPIWLDPGWYKIGMIPSHACSVRAHLSNGENTTPTGRSNSYGWGDTIYKAGSYSTGLPADGSTSGMTMLPPTTAGSRTWFGMRVLS